MKKLFGIICLSAFCCNAAGAISFPFKDLAVRVSFYSTGFGINNEILKIIREIPEAAKEDNFHVKYTESETNEKGEIDVCIQISKSKKLLTLYMQLIGMLNESVTGTAPISVKTAPKCN